MGVVFEATDLSLHRTVAVKVMTGKLYGDRVALGRFEREAMVLARLNHPSIVGIHDYGRLGGDGAFLVMERLAGVSWRNELRRLYKIPPPTAAVWFDQLLTGLRAAHKAGIVHRDLKPENVFLTSSGAENQSLKILDFGLAKMPSADNTLTASGVAMGTVAYMSPEQLRGEAIDETSDIFSVGVMAIEAITGRLPARATDGTIQPSSLADLLEFEEGRYRQPLRSVLQWCLADTAQARCPDAAEMRKHLVNALRSMA